MSEKAKKVYVPYSTGREHRFDDGNSVINLGFRVQDLIDFATTHARNGWLSLSVSKRREPSEKGYTHSVYLDTYTPKPKSDDSDMPF